MIINHVPRETYFYRDIFPVIIKYEGSKFTDDPKDPGGPTKWGITLKTAEKTMDCDLSCLKKMDKEDAALFYKTHFWDKYGADNIHNKDLSINVVLAQINLGPSRPSKMLQKMTNEFCNDDLVLDGRLGSKSIKAINKCKYTWPGYPYVLYYFYRYDPGIAPVWKWAHRGLKRRIFHGVDHA